GLITEEYSLKCVEYFGNADFSGQAFKDAIFQDPAQREQWDKVFDLFFLDDVMGFSSIASLLPQETIFLHPKGGEKHYSFSYYPCRDLKKKLIYVDVGISDTTIEKQLQKKRSLLEEERASRQKIYHDPAAYLQLLEISKEVQSRIDSLSGRLFDGESPQLEPSLLRMLHTLKGLSGMMLLKGLQTVTHQLETTLAPLVNIEAGYFDEALFLDQALDFSSASDQAIQLLDSLGEEMKARLTGVVLTREDFDLLKDIEEQKDFPRLERLLERLQQVPARKLVESWPDEVDRLSSKLGKRVKFIVKGEPISIPQKIADKLPPLLVHILRNAVDHAIELPDERVELGKSDYGRIEVVFALRGDNLQMVIQDDGKGIDFKDIENKAKANKNLDQDYIEALSKAGEIWKVLLLSGFSTAKQVTETSGRGIGLNALNEELLAMGGELTIKSVFGAGTGFLLTIPLVDS
ncbi:MAG: ATP-binding protein, partial [SAR324 cluster bacterium]|nr:ATP-binding protein [SAR324 cluster bacterium]